MLAPSGKEVRCPHCSALTSAPDRSGAVAPAANAGVSGGSAAGRQAGPGSEDSAPKAERYFARRCHECDNSIRLKAEFAGKTIKCPECDAEVPPNPGEDLDAVDVEAPLRPLASSVAWGLSLALHALLFLGLTGVNWLSGLESGDPGRKVRTITESESEPIVAGAASLKQLEGQPPIIDNIFQEKSSEVEIVVIGDTSTTSKTHSTVDSMKLTSITRALGSNTPGNMNWGDLGQGGGKGNGASFFGLEAAGSSFIYVVDYSGSMFGEKLQVAKSELIRSIRSLDRDMEFFIIFYDTHFVPMPAAELVRATEHNKARFITWVQNVGNGGGTDPTGAMLHALSLEPDAIWLMSDGCFGAQAANVIQGNNPGAEIHVHTIAFYDRACEAILERIATENDGEYRFVPRPGRRPGRGRRP